jgi:hypothetical protein
MRIIVKPQALVTNRACVLFMEALSVSVTIASISLHLPDALPDHLVHPKASSTSDLHTAEVCLHWLLGSHNLSPNPSLRHLKAHPISNATKPA